MLSGIRFDLSALMYINLPFMIASLLPFSFRNKLNFRSFLKILYVTPNLIFLLLSLIDFGYYRYTQRRTSVELFGMMNDLWPQLFSYLIGYWYLFIAFLLIVWLFTKFSNKLIQAPKVAVKNNRLQYIIFSLCAACFILAARGGTQLRPLAPINAADYVSTKQSAAVLNTPFVFLNSIFTSSIEYVNYMSDSDAEKLVQFIKPAYPDSLTQKKNVVVFILESFNREWIGNLNNRYFYTKFLDSISSRSIVCTNAYANAKHSNDGVPAILASIPSLMDESIIASVYQDNRYQGLGNVMKSMGYQTSFFHGARNGSFNFDAFAHRCGFDDYYGMNEYNDNNGFDGTWGIWDHLFLPYFASKLDQMKQPFCSVFFNISSHYPYSLPEEYKSRFMDAPNVNHLPRTIYYVDTCLQQFFDANKNKPWFNNTIFVFCADHTGEGNEPQYKTPIGIFRIPIIIYDPSRPVQIKIEKPVMQVDLLPSILDYLKIPVKHSSFGHSIFNNSSNKAYQFHENYYQVCNDSMLTIFNGREPIALYHTKKDPLLEHNLIKYQSAPGEDLRYLKAVLQVFRKRVKENRLTP
jgi:phosphoglycerol transferase MdoB-like AlkP superfamily enzyme